MYNLNKVLYDLNSMKKRNDQSKRYFFEKENVQRFIFSNSKTSTRVDEI